MTPEYAVVVPSVGRPSLETLLHGLSEQELPPVEVVVADDRPLRQTAPLAAAFTHPRRSFSSACTLRWSERWRRSRVTSAKSRSTWLIQEE